MTTLTIEKNGSDSSSVVSITNGSSGTITGSGTISVIVDVLEGTKPAFDLRDGKYQNLERLS